jgi:hypothetical protein
MPTDMLPEWERLLSSAARLQKILPAAVFPSATERRSKKWFLT